MKMKTKKSRHARLIGIVAALAVLAVGTMAAVDLGARKAQPPVEQVKRPALTQDSQTRLALVRGQLVNVNTQTGEFTPLTAEEARLMSEAIRQLANQSTEGLQQVKRGDGSVSMDLQGHFQNVMIARKNSDGNVEQVCVDNLQSASEFLHLNPKQAGPKGGESR